MKTCRNGNRYQDVKLAQRLLNKNASSSPQLAEDGIFGPKTESAVRAFQSAHRPLTVDGIVGNNTWARLGVTIDVSYRVKLAAQTTGSTCWSAAATMVLDIPMSFGPGSADLTESGGLRTDFENIAKFAQTHGLRMEAPQTWTVQGLYSLMRRSGPLWVAGWVPSGHVVCYGALQGDGTIDGTMITIYDPWPPYVGKVYGALYNDWIRTHPRATDYILHR